jgi:hypothetical protein
MKTKPNVNTINTDDNEAYYAMFDDIKLTPVMGFIIKEFTILDYFNLTDFCTKFQFEESVIEKSLKNLVKIGYMKISKPINGTVYYVLNYRGHYYQQLNGNTITEW